MTKILIATKNDGKAREYRKLFEPKGIEVITLKDLNEQVEIIENGRTFSENALIKAQTLTDKLNIPVFMKTIFFSLTWIAPVRSFSS